jgi:hypothetical protein
MLQEGSTGLAQEPAFLGLRINYGFLARESTEQWDSLGATAFGSK